MNTQQQTLQNLGISHRPLGISRTVTGLIMQALVIPAVASTTVQGTPVDASATKIAGSYFPTGEDFVVLIPAFTAGQLPNGNTITFTVQTCADPLFGSGIVTLGTYVVVGAGGVGAAAQEFFGPIPSSVLQFIRLQVATGVGAVPGANKIANFYFGIECF